MKWIISNILIYNYEFNVIVLEIKLAFINNYMMIVLLVSCNLWERMKVGVEKDTLFVHHQGWFLDSLSWESQWLVVHFL
jgi:hypothetical protein